MNVCLKSVKDAIFSLLLFTAPFTCKIFEGSAFKSLYSPFSNLKFFSLLYACIIHIADEPAVICNVILEF